MWSIEKEGRGVEGTKRRGGGKCKSDYCAGKQLGACLRVM